MSGVALGRRHC